MPHLGHFSRKKNIQGKHCPARLKLHRHDWCWALDIPWSECDDHQISAIWLYRIDRVTAMNSVMAKLGKTPSVSLETWPANSLVQSLWTEHNQWQHNAVAPCGLNSHHWLHRRHETCRPHLSILSQILPTDHLTQTKICFGGCVTIATIRQHWELDLVWSDSCDPKSLLVQGSENSRKLWLFPKKPSRVPDKYSLNSERRLDPELSAPKSHNRYR